MSESKIQSDCIIWCWNTYPETRGLLFHVANEGAKISTVELKTIALFILANVNNHAAVLTKARSLLQMATVGNAVGGAQAKSMGAIPGVADLIFLWDETAYFIEMKDEKGRLSDNQVKWAELVRNKGYQYYVCRSLDEFKLLIKTILG